VRYAEERGIEGPQASTVVILKRARHHKEYAIAS
jgi:hypothetical protein